SRNAESLARAADAPRQLVDWRPGLLFPAVVGTVDQAGRVLLAGLQRASHAVECPGQAGGRARPVTEGGTAGGGSPRVVRCAQAGAGATDRQTDARGRGQ